jgi:PAS domain S-box-containing protein
VPEIIDKVALHHIAHMSDVIIISDRHGRILRTNQRFHDELGYSSSAILAGTVRSYMLYEGGRREATRITRALLREGFLEHYTTRLRRTTGTLFEVELTLVLTGPERSGCVVGINKNVGALSQLLTEIGKLSEDWVLQRLVRKPQNTTMILTDPRGRILYCNHQTIEMLGFELREVINRHVTEFYQGGSVAARRNMKKALLREREGSGPQWYASLLKSRDGGFVPVDTLIRIYRDPASGEISSVLGVNALPDSGHKRVFLAHATADKVFVRKLSRALQDAGLEPWLDERSIPVSGGIPSELSEAVLSSDYLLFCASPDSVASAWCKEELETALMQEKAGRPVVVPVLIRSCTLPSSVRHRRYADLATNPIAGFLDLLALLRPDSANDPIASAIRHLIDDRVT